jgi:hypothetical protein
MARAGNGRSVAEILTGGAVVSPQGGQRDGIVQMLRGRAPVALVIGELSGSRWGI